MRCKAVLKRGDHALKTKTFTKQQLARTWLRAAATEIPSTTRLFWINSNPIISMLNAMLQRMQKEHCPLHTDSMRLQHILIYVGLS